MKSIQDKFNINVYFNNEVNTLEIAPRATVSVIDTTKSSITWKVSSLGYKANTYDYFEISISGGGSKWTETWLSNNTTYDTQIKVSGLDSGTTYTGSVTAYYNSKPFPCGSASGTTEEDIDPPKIYNISISSVTTTSFYYGISSYGEDYFNIIVTVRSTGEEVYSKSKTTIRTGTVSSLKPNTEYKISVSALNNGGSAFDYAFVTTNKQPTFSWTISPISGNNFTITASDWKELQTVVNEIRKIKGLSAYSFTVPLKGDIFYASYFNEVRSALNSISGISDLPKAVSSGDTCKASDFKAFETAIKNLTY